MGTRRRWPLLPLLLVSVEGLPLLGREWLQHIVLDWQTLFGSRGAVRKVEKSRNVFASCYPGSLSGVATATGPNFRRHRNAQADRRCRF